MLRLSLFPVCLSYHVLVVVVVVTSMRVCLLLDGSGQCGDVVCPAFDVFFSILHFLHYVWPFVLSEATGIKQPKKPKKKKFSQLGGGNNSKSNPQHASTRFLSKKCVSVFRENVSGCTCIPLFGFHLLRHHSSILFIPFSLRLCNPKIHRHILSRKKISIPSRQACLFFISPLFCLMSPSPSPHARTRPPTQESKPFLRRSVASVAAAAAAATAAVFSFSVLAGETGNPSLPLFHATVYLSYLLLPPFLLLLLLLLHHHHLLPRHIRTIYPIPLIDFYPTPPSSLLPPPSLPPSLPLINWPHPASIRSCALSPQRRRRVNVHDFKDHID